MAVPSAITDLSTTFASNSPSGSDAILPDLDDYLRRHAQFIALLRDGASFTDSVHLAGATQGTLGVRQGAGSGGTANVVGDDIVIDGDGNAGLSILSGVANAGNVIFGDLDNTAQGRLRYDHTVDELSLWTSSTQRFAVDSSGRVLVGDSLTSSYAGDASATPQIQLHGLTQSSAGFGIYNWSNGAAIDPRISLLKSKSNVIGTRGIVSNGDELGTIAFAGDDGVGFIRGALIRGLVDAAPGVNDMPTSLQFLTTPNGSDTPTLALTINSANQTVFSGDALVEKAGGVIGYKAGSGSTVTQATSKATGVTLDSGTGQITMNAASLAANTAVNFVLTNSAIDGNDLLLVNIGSGATVNSYTTTVIAVNSGSARIQVYNFTAGALAEALVLNFAVIKGANS